MRGGRDHRVGVADLLPHPGADVAGHVVVDQVGGLARPLHADDGREDLVRDGDAFRGVLGDVPVRRDDHHDRLTHMVHLVLGERVRRAAVSQGGMRNQQREGLGRPPVEVVIGVDGHQPIHLEGTGDVDVGDPGVRVRAADERHLKRVLAEVVQVTARSTQQPGILHSTNPRSEQLGRHRASVPRRISAARSTAVTMFW
jgi:hypothetical protein